ncbi:Uncharacterized protein Rs2_41013 [Raphanus sativus]|nr:Uncharacterized protein Rs2_41013 [Raphanus sativus]
MSSSQNEKKDSDIEMGEASQAPPASTVPDVTQLFVDGFRSFKDKLSRRSAEKRAGAETHNVPSSPMSPSPTPGSDVPCDAPLPVERTVVPEQTLNVQARPSGSSTAPIVISGQEDAVE